MKAATYLIGTLIGVVLGTGTPVSCHSQQLFHHGFNLYGNWSQYLESATNTEVYSERYAGNATFWRPTAAATEGEIVYHFPLSNHVSTATLTAGIAVWTTGDAFPYDPGAYAYLDVSANGTVWTNLDGRYANHGGGSSGPYDITPYVQNSTEIWVRARLLGTTTWYGDGLIFSQFLRTGSGSGDTFILDAVLMPPAINHTATGTLVLMNGFVVHVNITDGGYGYTNTPTVRIIGGCGSGAQAESVVSNGVVIAVNVMNAGYGYTNTPIIVIDPPFIPNPVLSIAPMSFLTFSNLTLGGVYQLQQSVAWYWSNQPVSFTATNASCTQTVPGVASSSDYRLTLSPVPAQAFATAEVYYGFVVNAALTSGGSGYVTTPAVTIAADGGGSNATAVAQISGGVVTNIIITSTGIGYTNTPTVQIAPPPAAAVSPTAVLPVMRVDSANLAPYDNYQIQFKPALGEAWGNWNGGLLSPTGVTNSQYLLVTNGTGFFRLQYVP